VEKPVFIRVHGMGLHFDHELASEREDALEAAWRLQR
jgi:hypothetical protein